MKVRWTRPAIADLDEIEDYIALDDVERAVDFVNQLIDIGESLDVNWNRGTRAKWTSNPNVRELYYKNYTLIYEVLKDEIQIHEVHNCAKMIRHFKK
jgi:plasmid stabilization system protein ParE